MNQSENVFQKEIKWKWLEIFKQRPKITAFRIQENIIWSYLQKQNKHIPSLSSQSAPRSMSATIFRIIVTEALRIGTARISWWRHSVFRKRPTKADPTYAYNMLDMFPGHVTITTYINKYSFKQFDKTNKNNALVYLHITHI